MFDTAPNMRTLTLISDPTGKFPKKVYPAKLPSPFAVPSSETKRNSLREEFDIRRNEVERQIQDFGEFELQVFNAEEYTTFLGTFGDRCPVRSKLIGNKVIFYEIPSRTHESVSPILSGTISGFNTRISGDFEFPRTNFGSTTYFLDGSPREPDASISFRSQFPEQFYPPSVIVEVGFSESFRQLLEDKATWFSDPIQLPIQMVILFKIYPLLENPRERAMVCLVFSQSDPEIPIQVVSFGSVSLSPNARRIIADLGREIKGVGEKDDPECDSRNIPLYQLVIPPEVIYHGVPEEALPQGELKNENLVIDLFRYQSLIMIS